MLLFLACVLLFLSFFVREGFVANADQEVTFKVNSKDLVTRIQLNTLIPSGDAWINLGDITIRDKKGNVVNYGNTNNVYFGNRGNWDGLPVQHLWDDSKTSMAHSNRQVENLIIKLGTGVEVGSVQITNRDDCCWGRIGTYRLSVYNSQNDELGYVNLTDLVGKGKTVKYILDDS